MKVFGALKDEQGFSVLDIALSVLLVGAIGIAGYFAYQNYNKQMNAVSLAPSPSKKLAPSPTPNPPASWPVASLPTEGLHFSYPSNWSITDKTIPSVAPGTYSDQATLTAPDGFTVSLQTGVSGIGGSYVGYKVNKSEPISSLGMNMRLNFVSTSGSTETVNLIGLATDPTCIGICKIADKHISYQGLAFQMFFSASVSADGTATMPVEDVDSNSDVKTLKTIFHSLAY